MMSFLMALLAASVIGSLIWLVLTVLKPLTQKAFSQTWHYYTGLIPAFFLLGAAGIISAGINAIAALIQTIAPVIAESPSEPGSGLAPPVFIYNYGDVIEKTGETVAKARLTIEMLAPLILIVWLIGAFVFLAWKIAAYTRFRRSISKIGNPSTNTDCQLSVLVCPGVATPMLVGVFMPVIILPERDYNERERTLILSHETAHWRHGDMFIKLLLLVVNALHWFNPLVYRINKEAARLCENACDESLARNMDKIERVLYGELILSTVTYENAPTLCSAMSEGANLKRRLLYMLNGKKMKKPVMILAIMVACAVVAGGVWLALPINSVAAYSVEGADDLASYEKDAVVAPEREITDDMSLGTIEDEGGIVIDGGVAIYVKGRKAVHMTIDGYNAWVAAGENDADVYNFAEKLSTMDLGDTPIDEMPDETYLWPLADYTRISSEFGNRMHPVEKIMFFHDGIDIAATTGTPILATKAGTIGEIGENSTDGLYVILDHGAGLTTFYAHMNEYAEGIANGDPVEKGDIIGYVGSTGKSTGSHLHFGISIDGFYINPLNGFEQT